MCMVKESAVYNSSEVRSVDITWKEGRKSITVQLNNGEKFFLKNQEGVHCPGNPNSEK